tara:strand:+ start:7833 stop:9275 length:1443 start_codon:yes stop_codon:yes gene_type:complete
MGYTFASTHDSTAIQPEQSQVVTNANYLDFQANGEGWSKQFLPELYEEEVERYGNRTLNGFLRMVGAEMPMTSDQVIWSEQNRLHIGHAAFSGGKGAKLKASDGHTANKIEIYTLGENCAVRIGDLLSILEPASSKRVVAIVTAKTVAGTTAGGNLVTTLTVDPYNYVALSNATLAAGEAVNLFVFGSEFAKGSAGRTEALQPVFTTKTNNPIIIKDYYEVNGSDAAQIGWVEVATEDGTSGYLWYLKAESETRLRFEDYLEMAMVESVPGTNAALAGTEGMLHQIETGGHVFQSGNADDLTLADFDSILSTLDKQGAIEENMLFLNRSMTLEIDDLLAGLNSYGSGGTSYGLFDNDENMALNLGFSGFRRGSYDFYKTDWRYLNDATTRGLLHDLEGVVVPAGTSTVYDQQLGSNIRRPFLHVRYRASETEDRRMKSWVLGSVGGAATSSTDNMEVHFLSERCLVVQGANNFVLLKDVA